MYPDLRAHEVGPKMPEWIPTPHADPGTYTCWLEQRYWEIVREAPPPDDSLPPKDDGI